MEADNFAGLSRGPIASRAQLDAALGGYRPSMGAVNRELAVGYHGARAHAHQLCALLDRVDPPADLGEAPLRELSRLARVQWRTELRARAVEQASREAHERTEQAQVELAALRDEQARTVDENRALTAELGRLRGIHATRRVRAGIRLGELADGLRRRLAPR
jgi:hypothetical protein